MENLVTVTIRSTHYYLIDIGQGKLMIDAGWAGGLPALRGQLERYKIEFSQIHYLMITHLHPDHAGLTQEIKKAGSARLMIHEIQLPYLTQLEAFYADKGGYLPIQIEENDIILTSSNRDRLGRMGVQGEIIKTPGHSDDSVSLVLDSGKAFTGDLHPPDFVEGEAREITCRSWKAIQGLQAKMIFPAHGNPFHIDELQKSLEYCL